MGAVAATSAFLDHVTAIAGIGFATCRQLQRLWPWEQFEQIRGAGQSTRPPHRVPTVPFCHWTGRSVARQAGSSDPKVQLWTPSCQVNALPGRQGRPIFGSRPGPGRLGGHVPQPRSRDRCFTVAEALPHFEVLPEVGLPRKSREPSASRTDANFRNQIGWADRRKSQWFA
jgi:hypothetical protein